VFRIRNGLNTNPDLDPDPAFEVKTDPDPAKKANTDPDPGFFMTGHLTNIFLVHSYFLSQIAIYIPI